MLVFDGVEKLQVAPGIDPEAEGGTFGQFLAEGSPLGLFLRWASEGPRPAHVLITSRFGLTDLRRYQPSAYRAVKLLELPDESARTLLRAHGVRGPDEHLNSLIEEFGNHAQTLDLLGNALRIWCDGDPERVSELPPLEDVKKMPGIRDEAWGRVRVLRFYEQKLPLECLGLLQLLCAFEVMPVDAQLLQELANIERSTPTQSITLSRATKQDIEGYLISLQSEYSLIQQRRSRTRAKTYAAHPSVRDYFKKEPFHKDISDYLLTTPAVQSLRSRIRPTNDGEPLYVKPIDIAHLDTLEELIRHMLRIGRIGDAWILYCAGMGKFARLGARLGLFSRGERLARMFARSQLSPTTNAANIIALEAFRRFFLNEWGIYALNLGRLHISTQYYQMAAEIASELGDLTNTCIFCANLCEANFLRGHLKNAIDAGGYALQAAAEDFPDPSLSAYSAEDTWIFDDSGIYVLSDPQMSYDHLEFVTAYVAYALGLRGLSGSSSARFTEASGYFQQTMQRPDRIALSAVAEGLASDEEVEHLHTLHNMLQNGRMMSIAGVYHAAALLRWGETTLAQSMLTDNRKVCEKSGLQRDVARCDILLAEIDRQEKRYNQAAESLALTLNWGQETGDLEVLVWANIIGSHLAVDSNDLGKAEDALLGGLRIAEYCGYGLHWIDLQVASGQWELTCGRQLQAGERLSSELGNRTPEQWFEQAEASALKALNGQLNGNDDPAPRPDFPEDHLSMLGARHPECGYAWGEGDALHLLGEALLRQGKSQEARHRLQEALDLRQRIQDPKAKETQKLLSQLMNST